MISIEKLFELYFECRKTKRRATGALAFEIDYEENLLELCDELNQRTWKPGACNCFIVEKPVKREIFAAPFKDRIVHHILIDALNPCFERFFIKDSFACRTGKGTLAAIKRLAHFVNSASQNGKKSAYILKLDIKGYFMSINRNLLYEKLERFIESKYRAFLYEKNETKEQNKAHKGDWIFEIKEIEDKIGFVKYLAKEIVFNDPTKQVNFKSPKSAWNGLPRDKSLFTAKEGCGLPIGNLTSQVFANFFLTEFDHYIKHTLRLKRYVRYVDDFVIVHESKSYLKYLIPKIRAFLKDELALTLHPKKIYLQEAQRGVPFLGAFIKPNLILAGRRVQKNFVQKMQAYERLAHDHKPTKEEKNAILASTNSYLGILRQYKSWKLRVAVLKKHFAEQLSKHFGLKKDALKLEKKKWK
ncbi:MAG: hypothetical protein IJ158_11380 [Treponema sp.]|nr:hypothetical protein [Treponema sp.]